MTWAKPKARLLAKVKVAEDGCWNWIGSLDVEGYARICYSGHNRRASQVSWMVHNETEWPKPLMALHSCDNRRCVNPAHIRPGTNSENVKEAWDRGGLRPRRFKSHCPQGHEYTPENLAFYPSIPNTRRCRICDRARSIVQKIRRKQQSALRKTA